MPFPKVTCQVPELAQNLGQGEFIERQMPLVRSIEPIAAGIASGQTAATGGCTPGSGGIEAIEADTLFRHGVEVRRPQHWMTIVSDVAPALVVGHTKDHVLGAGLGLADPANASGTAEGRSPHMKRRRVRSVMGL